MIVLLKKIPLFLVLALGTGACATHWVEVEETWKPTKKKALAVHFKFSAKDAGPDLLDVVVNAVADEVHPYEKAGMNAFKGYKKYFGKKLKLKLVVDKDRVEKIDKLPKFSKDTQETVDKLGLTDWMLKGTSRIPFHLAATIGKEGQFKDIAESLAKKGKEDVYASVGFMFTGDTHWLFWESCKVTTRFRILDTAGKPIYQGTAAGQGSSSFFGDGVSPEHCDEAIQDALKNLNEVEIKKGISNFG